MLRSRTKTTQQNAVVYMNDGTRRKGIVDGFNPNQTTMLVKEIEVSGNVVEIHDIDLRNVHAIFFVRDLALMRTSRHTSREAATRPPATPSGKRIRVVMVWGEVLDGVSPNYDENARWFYLFPDGMLNRAYNIKSIYITRKATTRVEEL